jgi:hypothetical protein
MKWEKDENIRPTKDQRDRWVRALRSGKYQKGEGVLKRVCPDGSACFCAIGVFLQETYGDGIWEKDYNSYSETTVHSPKGWDKGEFSDLVPLSREMTVMLYNVNDKDDNGTWDDVIFIVENIPCRW